MRIEVTMKNNIFPKLNFKFRLTKTALINILIVLLN